MSNTSGKGTKRKHDKEGLDMLGARLRTIRTEKKMTQEDLAGFSGIALSQIGRIERGEVNCTVTSVFGICRALDIEVSELFTFKLENNIIN